MMAENVVVSSTSRRTEMLKKSAVLLATLAMVMGLAACNTVKGAGKDVERAGEGIQKAAEKVQQ